MNPTETRSEFPATNEVDDRSMADAIEIAREVSFGRQLQFDGHGHAIPPTAAEQAADAEAWSAAIAEMATLPDDPPGSDEAFWRAIDAQRPERPLFRELYEK